jgi:hypothetical protein
MIKVSLAVPREVCRHSPFECTAFRRQSHSFRIIHACRKATEWSTSMSLIDLLPVLHNSPAVAHNSVQPEILRLNIAFIAVTSCFIIARVLVRTFLVKHVAIEDYLMVAAGLFATAFSAMAIVGT